MAGCFGFDLQIEVTSSQGPQAKMQADIQYKYINAKNADSSIC